MDHQVAEKARAKGKDSEKPHFGTIIEDYDLYLQYLELKGFVNKDCKLPYWGNFPINSDMLRPIYDVYEPKMKFLDLGCGAGNVLRFAKNIGYDTYGIEFNPIFFQFLSEHKCECIDIQLASSKYISNFDVIYIYRPLKHNYNLFLKNLVSNMKTGAILYTPHDYFPHDRLFHHKFTFMTEKR